MKVLSGLFAMIALGGFAANTSYAQYRPATANQVAKNRPVTPPASPAARHGSIGGPVNKRGGIGGLANKTGGINGTVRPKY